MTEPFPEQLKQIASRLTEIERTLRATVAEMEQTTLSHVNHNPKRIAEAQKCLNKIDLDALIELQRTLRKLRSTLTAKS